MRFRLSAVFLCLLFIGFGCTPSQLGTTDGSGSSEKVQQLPENGTYTIALDESIVAWEAFRVRYGHDGEIDIQTGEIKVSGKKFVSAEVVLDMTSFRNLDMEGFHTRIKKFEEHVKSNDFLAVEQFPTAVFTLSSAELRTDGRYDFTGLLLMRGIEDVVSFPGDVSVDGDRIHLEADFDIDRTKWDITFGSGGFFEDLGDNLIKDEVTIHLNILAKKK